jgi:hypothetical protein
MQAIKTVLAIAATFALLPGLAQAQTAEEYFHGGAQSFIGEKLDEATAAVRSGLAAYPTDEQLLRLDELIKQAQEQQQQQNQGESNEQEQSENQDSENENGGEQGDPGEQDQQGDQSESEQQEQDQQEEQDPQEEDGEDGSQGDQREEQPEDGSEAKPSDSPIDPDQLSEEEAERILQALANEEEQLLREVQKIKGRPRRVEKDW